MRETERERERERERVGGGGGRETSNVLVSVYQCPNAMLLTYREDCAATIAVLIFFAAKARR